MDQDRQQARPPLTVAGLAKTIDHALLRPELTEREVLAGCEAAKRYQVASVTVRPCDVDTAVRAMENSGVAVGCVSGFPHGDQNTGTKLYETRDLLRRGAKEIDMVVNISKLLSRQFQYVEMEILQMAEACHKSGAILKVIFENAYLTDELKIVASRICARAEADIVKTSTGFAPERLAAAGYTIGDLNLMRANFPDEIGAKAAGGVRTLDEALELYEWGCARFDTTQTSSILDGWKARLAAEAASPTL